jgi:hypothetical protein
MRIKDKWVPHVGYVAKFKMFEDYRQQGLGGHEWSNLKVVSVDKGDIVSVELLNGDQPTGETVECRGSLLDAPLFWCSTYDIYAASDKADSVRVGWFKRGINVWGNHDLGSSSVGPSTFTPKDVEMSPGWRYGANPVETIEPDECPHVFNVYSCEGKEDYELIPSIGSMGKKERRKAIAKIKTEGWKLTRDSSLGWRAFRETLVHKATPW